MYLAHSLEDRLLERCRQSGTALKVITTNGFQMEGRVTGHDGSVIVLDTREGQRVVYKHAVSTLVPAETIDMKEAE